MAEWSRCGEAGLFVILVALCGAVARGAGPVAPTKLQAFDLSRVRLLDGPCKVAQEANRRTLHLLDSDRLLHNFRTNAKLPAPGQPLGGWEAPNVEVRGHFVGHYLSACALMVTSTGDEKLKAKADALVAELAKVQQALGDDYLSAFPLEYFDRLEAGKPVWVPWYTLHKIMAGLLDMHQLCGNEQALDVLKRMAAWTKRRTDRLSDPHLDRVLRVEFGGMSEVLHNLHAVTGDPMHLALAHRFDQAEFLGPLALEHDNLSGIHANTNIPKIAGAARRYELTGDDRYRIATAYFWDRVVRTRSYVTGGSNRGEHWSEPHKLAATLAADNQECCTTYNMLKVTRYVLRWTADPQYGDYYERAFWNGILGTLDPATGMTLYFVPLATGHSKHTANQGFSKPTDSFWCCTGTGVESFAKLGDSIFFHDDDGLTVNLFIASTVDWREKGVTVEQRTRFPEEEGTTLVVRTKQPATFALRVRMPGWATRGASVTVNGQAVPCEAKPTSYLTLRREWKDGDQVQVRLPMSLTTEAMPDDPELVAFLYGPLVLLGLTQTKVHFLGDARQAASWLKPVEGKTLTFRTVGQPTDLTFRPFYQVLEEPYGVYWLVMEKDGPRHKQLLAEEEAKRKREARVLDRVKSHDKASEDAHHLQGENTQSGTAIGRGWRHAAGTGWWSWDLRVLPDAPMTLACTYWGSDVPPRTFDLLVDGQKIATQAIDRNKPGEFFDVEYKLPPDLTKGKTKVTVRFVPHQGHTAGGVFECATLKP